MRTLTYSKPHRLSQLHDELIAAGITPLRVEGKDNDIWLTVEDGVSDSAVQARIDAHVPIAPPLAPDVKQLGIAYKNALTAAGNFAQLKSALLNEQMALWRAIAKGYRGDV